MAILKLKLWGWLVTISIFSLKASQTKKIEHILQTNPSSVYDLPEYEEWEHGDVWEGDDFYFTSDFPDSENSYGYMPYLMVYNEKGDQLYSTSNLRNEKIHILKSELSFDPKIEYLILGEEFKGSVWYQILDYPADESFHPSNLYVQTKRICNLIADIKVGFEYQLQSHKTLEIEYISEDTSGKVMIPPILMKKGIKISALSVKAFEIAKKTSPPTP